MQIWKISMVWWGGGIHVSIVSSLVGRMAESNYKPWPDTRLLATVKINKVSGITVTYLSGDPWAPGREVTWSTTGRAALVKTEPGK